MLVHPVRGLTAADLMPAYDFAFANIPSNRAVLQFLVDDYCKSWVEEFEENAALHELPPAFVTRALRKYSNRLCTRRRMLGRSAVTSSMLMSLKSRAVGWIIWYMMNSGGAVCFLHLST